MVEGHPKMSDPIQLSLPHGPLILRVTPHGGFNPTHKLVQ
jgi:hypothetical protein